MARRERRPLTLVICAALAVWIPTRSPAQATSQEPDASPTIAEDPADERAAERVLGTPADDAPDPTADEDPARVSAEGEAVTGNPDVAMEIAALSDRQCLRVLSRARVPFERIHRRVPGVALPIHLTGPVQGVRYRSNEQREINEILDCRLAVALVRFSNLLTHLGIVEVRHYSMYRPPTSRAVAEHPLQTRHPGGLAIDAAWFFRRDGARFSVEHDFHGRIGDPVCGPDARVLDREGARVLRTIACDAARRGLFNVILTPNFNRPHENHFHLEIARGVSWRFVH